MKINLYKMESGTIHYYYVDIGDIRYRITYNSLDSKVHSIEKVGLSNLPNLGRPVLKKIPPAVELSVYRIAAMELEKSMGEEFLPPIMDDIPIGEFNKIESTQMGEYDALRYHSSSSWGWLGFILGALCPVIGVLIIRYFAMRSKAEPDVKKLAALSESKSVKIDWYKQAYLQMARKRNKEVSFSTSILGTVLMVLVYLVLFVAR